MSWLTTYYTDTTLLIVTREKLTEMPESEGYTDDEKQRLSDNAVFIAKDDDGAFYDIPPYLEEKFNLREGINLKIAPEYNEIWEKDAFIKESKWANPANWPDETILQLYFS